MMKFRAALLCLAGVLALLGGCRTLKGANSCHKPQAYQASKSVAPLKVPPGLAALDTSQVLRLPVLNEPAPPPRSSKGPCLDEPPSFKVPKAAAAPQA